MGTNMYPRDLARSVRQRIAAERRRLLPESLLTELLETAYFASMRTEESHGITCTIALLDYAQPDTPPRRIRAHRASLVRFAHELPYSVKVLTKLAQAADVASTCVAVAAKADGKLFIIGLIDQEVHHQNLVRHESDVGNLGRRGLLQVEVTGVGALAVYDDTTMIAGLRQNTLVTNFIEVFQKGPILQLLRTHVDALNEQVRRETGGEYDRESWWSFDDWESLIRDLWIGTLCRTLLAIQRYGHGGALLLLPDLSLEGLSLKYSIDYPKLNEVLVLDAVNDIHQRVAAWDIHDEHLNQDDAPMSPQLHLRHEIARNDREDAIKAEAGAVQFIASLSRVDGLVLLTEGLRVRGFGVEITVRDDPAAMFIASDAGATVKGSHRGDLNHFGTRHRSMMRYCNAHPGSVGFVISQDGDVRAIARWHDRLVLWENVRLHDIDQAIAPKEATR